jgi:hypothetical protein
MIFSFAIIWQSGCILFLQNKKIIYISRYCGLIPNFVKTVIFIDKLT